MKNDIELEEPNQDNYKEKQLINGFFVGLDLKGKSQEIIKLFKDLDSTIDILVQINPKTLNDALGSLASQDPEPLTKDLDQSKTANSDQGVINSLISWVSNKISPVTNAISKVYDVVTENYSVLTNDPIKVYQTIQNLKDKKFRRDLYDNLEDTIDFLLIKSEAISKALLNNEDLIVKNLNKANISKEVAKDHLFPLVNNILKSANENHIGVSKEINNIITNSSSDGKLNLSKLSENFKGLSAYPDFTKKVFSYENINSIAEIFLEVENNKDIRSKILNSFSSDDQNKVHSIFKSLEFISPVLKSYMIADSIYAKNPKEKLPFKYVPLAELVNLSSKYFLEPKENKNINFKNLITASIKTFKYSENGLLCNNFFTNHCKGNEEFIVDGVNNYFNTHKKLKESGISAKQIYSIVSNKESFEKIVNIAEEYANGENLKSTYHLVSLIIFDSRVREMASTYVSTKISNYSKKTYNSLKERVMGKRDDAKHDHPSTDGQSPTPAPKKKSSSFAESVGKKNIDKTLKKGGMIAAILKEGSKSDSFAKKEEEKDKEKTQTPLTPGTK